MVAIIDYGMGNIRSIQNMLFRIGAENCITSDKREILAANKLILPGVGAFAEAMKRLTRLKLTSIIKYKVREEKTPILGICLGMQLLSKYSEEGGHHLGLGLIEGETVRLGSPKLISSLRIPHMGWNTICLKRYNKILEGLDRSARFYFVHSYHVQCTEIDDVLATTYYGMEYVSIIQRENIYATQFHPEKSHRYGMQLLRNFTEIN